MKKGGEFLRAATAAVALGLAMPGMTSKSAIAAESGQNRVDALVCPVPAGEQGLPVKTVITFEVTDSTAGHIRKDEGNQHTIYYKDDIMEWNSKTRKGIKRKMGVDERAEAAELPVVTISGNCSEVQKDKAFFRPPKIINIKNK